MFLMVDVSSCFYHPFFNKGKGMVLPPSQERDALLSPLVLLVRRRVLIRRSSRGASSVWHQKKAPTKREKKESSYQMVSGKL
jgi:hypothetical protein